MKNIVWLASYPKSGNTWVRTLLTCLLKDTSTEQPLINELIAPVMASRDIIDEHLLLETSELTQDEIESYTPLALRELSRSLTYHPFFMKTHTAYTHTTKGEPIYPADVSIGTIYIVRNILDVIVSYAHHNTDTIEHTISNAALEDFLLLNRTDDIRPQVPQKLLSWSRHVQSWKNQSEIPVLFIRYEDLFNDTFNIFKEIIAFSGLTATDEEIENAIRHSSFDALQQQEKKFGFRERKGKESIFFRKGKIGSWRESLSDEQVKRIIQEHREVMLQLGYIDAGGNPLY